MDAHELLKVLNEIPKDELKNIPIRVIRDDEDDEENHWVYKGEISNKGSSGYPEGEIRLFTSE